MWVLTSNAATRQRGNAATQRTSISFPLRTLGLLIASEDCAAGTCYGGACVGDPNLYSLDGECGPSTGNLICTGKWGECCNYGGLCGSGSDFCSKANCQSGACYQLPMPKPTDVSPFGTTPDGSCGGSEGYTGGVIFGNCCNKDNKCGLTPLDCGTGWYVCLHPDLLGCANVLSSVSPNLERAATLALLLTLRHPNLPSHPRPREPPRTVPVVALTTTLARALHLVIVAVSQTSVVIRQIIAVAAYVFLRFNSHIRDIR